MAFTLSHSSAYSMSNQYAALFNYVTQVETFHGCCVRLRYVEWPHANQSVRRSAVTKLHRLTHKNKHKQYPPHHETHMLRFHLMLTQFNGLMQLSNLSSPQKVVEYTMNQVFLSWFGTLPLAKNQKGDCCFPTLASTMANWHLDFAFCDYSWTQASCQWFLQALCPRQVPINHTGNSQSCVYSNWNQLLVELLLIIITSSTVYR